MKAEQPETGLDPGRARGGTTAQGAALIPAPLGGTQENHKWQVKDKTFISQH